MAIGPSEITRKKPAWLKVKLPTHENFFYVSNLVKEQNLHTICQSARCPNLSECWSHKTATFLILGDTCTRACAFCAVRKGKPVQDIQDEPVRVAESVKAMGLKYAVITSVTRDDLPDGGAGIFVQTLQAVKEQNPNTRIELLIPDFNGNKENLYSVLQAGPDILNHNLEVPEALYPLINRPLSNYRRSLEVLKTAKEAGAVTKSGLMLGLGESRQDIIRTLQDLRAAACDLLTIGQYLQATKKNIPVAKYYSPEEFSDLRDLALTLGFTDVESGPLVRSSYMAHKLFRSIKKTRDQ